MPDIFDTLTEEKPDVFDRLDKPDIFDRVAEPEIDEAAILKESARREEQQRGFQQFKEGETTFLRSVAEDPLGFVKALPEIGMGAVTGPGKLAYAAAADVVSKVADQPEYGGNLAAMQTAGPLPVEQFLSAVSKTNPNLATAAKVGKSVTEMAPLGVVGMLPAWAARLAGLGFSASMIASAPAQFKQYAEEINKPPAEQDPDKLTTLQSDIIQTFAFAPLAGAPAVGKGISEVGKRLEVTPGRPVATETTEDAERARRLAEIENRVAKSDPERAAREAQRRQSAEEVAREAELAKERAALEALKQQAAPTAPPINPLADAFAKIEADRLKNQAEVERIEAEIAARQVGGAQPQTIGQPAAPSAPAPAAPPSPPPSVEARPEIAPPKPNLSGGVGLPSAITTRPPAPAPAPQTEEIPTTTAIRPGAVPTIEFPLSALKLSKDVPNFKAGASEATGIVPGQQLAGKYERTGTAPIVVWERLNGDHEVITGRHRLDLARRMGEKTIPTQIVREADGFTKDMALTFDAEANIRDGQGEVSDYATYFKGTNIDEAEARARGLLSRAKGQTGWNLARAATDDVYALWRDGRIDEKQAVAIATAAPGDAGAQQIGAKFALQGKSADFIQNVIKASQAEAGQRAQTLDLFGNDDSAMRAMAEQASRASQFQRELNEQIRAVSGAVKRPDIARKLGVDVKDPAAVAAKLDELRGELARWQDWPLQPDLVAKVKGSDGRAANVAPVAARPAPPAETPFNLSQPESIAEQQARLEHEATIAKQKSDAAKLAEAAVKPLVGSVGDIGQRDIFGGGDLFASPEIAGGAELPPEPPPRGRSPVEDDPHHSVLDAVPLGMQEAVQLTRALTGSFPKIREVLRALGGRAAGIFRHTDAERQVRNPATGELEWVATGKQPKGSIELRADIFDVITAAEKAELRAQADQYARAASRDPREMAKIAEERYKFLLDEMRKTELPRRHSVEALKVIFHEIGHLIDWLPNNIVRGRGNLFGHIATLKNYLKWTLPLDPTKPAGEKLTPADKAKLQEEALRQMRAEVGPMRDIVRKIIVEEPEWKITGISAEDIKNILGEGAGKDTPELTRWFAEQDSKVKAEVLRKAMKGLIDERLAAMGKREQIGTRKVEREVRERFGREPTPQEIRDRFRELLAKEIRARNLADLETVKSEMRSAIAWWRGTEEMPPYFNTGAEMYAEAFSMFFNNPAGFAKRAPTTARLLWNYMDRKRDVSSLYDKIQSQIKSGEIYKVRVENLHDMWTRDNERSLEAGKAGRKTSWRDFYENVAYHIDRIGGPVYRAAMGSEREGALRQAWGDFLYRAAEHERYFAQSNRDVGALLVKHNLDWNHDFGEYLYHQRVLKERFSPVGAPIANPLGWDVKDSTARLAEMREALGPERWAALKEAGRRFYDIHQSYVVAPVAAGRMFAPELNQLLTERTHYATFSAVRNLPDNGIERMIELQYGPAVTPHIYRQIGNLGEIKNPATATMLKGASLISAVARNALKRELVRALKETEAYPGEQLKPAEMTWNGKARVPKIIDGPEVGTIVYLADGQPQAFYVRKVLADSVNGDNPLANHAASVLQRSKGILKGVFTQQPGFWAFNLVRDTAGFWAQMPGIRAPLGHLAALPRAIAAARASVKGRANPYADAALQRRMLISRMEQGGSWTEVADEWEHRVSGYGFDPAAWNKELTNTERALKVWHEWMGWGKTIERANKLAGMIYLDEYAPPKYRNAPEWQKREWVRGLAGSPDFLERGRSANTIDWAFLFYNPWKEGMRSLVKAARTDPIGFTAKATALMAVPTVLQAMAYNGAFGDDLKKRYRAVGLYDLTNYLLPHVSSPDKNGAVGVFRLPLFEPHRVLHGVLFQMLTGQGEGMINHAGGQLPGLNPIITAAYQWASYLTGHNPPDFFRSTNLLTDQQQAARGGAHGLPGRVFDAPALATMAQQTWNNLGGTVLYRFKNLNLENPPETDAQKILSAPVLNNIIGRWYKVTDAGVKDQARLEVRAVAQQEAQFDAAKNVMLEKIVDKFWPALAKRAAGHPLAPADHELLKQPVDWTKSEIELRQDPHFQQYLKTRESEIMRKFIEIMSSRLSPLKRQLNVGSSQLQDVEILRNFLQPK